ncbi:hypothetical protein RRG08_020006 [Elysia crispata]|uniref:Uncharacterized protein n=1 Tax=Elysia crispata TaxID=231223 RepID=A0AAE1EDN7_9GAST|nr:hypothetical protein RRG08_020006 [Elysia crispata]
MTIGDAQCEERWRELKAHTQTLGSKLCLFPCSYVTVDTAVCPGERKIRARDNTEGRGYGKGLDDPCLELMWHDEEGPPSSGRLTPRYSQPCSGHSATARPDHSCSSRVTYGVRQPWPALESSIMSECTFSCARLVICEVKIQGQSGADLNVFFFP